MSRVLVRIIRKLVFFFFVTVQPPRDSLPLSMWCSWLNLDEKWVVSLFCSCSDSSSGFFSFNLNVSPPLKQVFTRRVYLEVEAWSVLQLSDWVLVDSATKTCLMSKQLQRFPSWASVG